MRSHAAPQSWEAYFPAVLHYRREGGSLEQVEGSAVASDSLPGKVLHFRQFLVSASSPTLSLGSRPLAGFEPSIVGRF